MSKLITQIVKKTTLLGLVMASITATAVLAEKFRPYSIEGAEFEIIKMPNKISNGEILVYASNSEDSKCVSRNCAKRFALDKSFRTEVGGEYSLIENDLFKSLPRQPVDLFLYEEGVVKVVSFRDIVLPDDGFLPSAENGNKD